MLYCRLCTFVSKPCHTRQFSIAEKSDPSTNVESYLLLSTHKRIFHTISCYLRAKQSNNAKMFSLRFPERAHSHTVRRCKKASSSHATVIFLNPCAQELRQNEIIDRLKAFSLIPDPGTVIEVSAGEGRPLVITYSADSLLYGGVHDLPVLASTRGSQIYIDFSILFLGDGQHRARGRKLLF